MRAPPHYFAAMIVCMGALSSASAPCRAEDVQQPVEMVRLMHDIQSQVASGAEGGQEAMQAMVRAMGEQFDKLDVEVWRAPRNARAAALYLLSGGDAAVVRRILDSKTVTAAEEKLLRGALAFVEGRVAEARKLFGEVDARAVDPPLGAHIAFAQASLLPPAESVRARGLLELARLLAPGGLVEEAALRREVFVAGETGDVQAFADLSRRYARRFRGSAYFDNFARKFTAVTAAFPLEKATPFLPLIEEAARDIGVDNRREFYLQLSRRAIAEGKNDLGARAASEAARIATDSRSGRARAALYQAAARVGPHPSGPRSRRQCPAPRSGHGGSVTW